jgi:peptidoglycan/xylan/chitin deacetylase (PgdA/CDA1 family)
VSARSTMVGAAVAGIYHGRLTRALALVAAHVGPPAFPILTYHRVNDEGDPFFPALPTPVFERHMAHVARHYRVLTVEALVERMRRSDVPRNALAITFDDGYRDNLTHAAPILARHGLPATVFLATGLIGNGEVSWFDRLAMAVKLTTVPALPAPWGERLDLATTPARLRTLERAQAALKAMPDDERSAALESLVEGLGGVDPRGFKSLMLSWDDVQALAGMGFAIGSHTVSHPVLSRLSRERAWAEILGSRTMIEAACGMTPKAFAYPNGRTEDYTTSVARMVEEAGFTCAVTTRFGVNTAATSPWELHRGGPGEHDVPTFAVKLAASRLLAR